DGQGIAVSPNGNAAYIVCGQSTPGGRLVKIDANGAQTVLHASDGSSSWWPQSVDVDPNSGNLVLGAWQPAPTGGTKVLAMNSDGSGETVLAGNGLDSLDPVFSPDGSQI